MDMNEKAYQEKYERAVAHMESARTEEGWTNVAELFAGISDYKDAAFLELQCMEQAKQCRVEAEEMAEAAKAKKSLVKIVLLIALVIAAGVSAVAFVQSQKASAYEQAGVWASNGEYDKSIAAYLELGEYKDSASRADMVLDEAYGRIFAYLDEEKYKEAYDLCLELRAYRDCEEMAGQISAEYDRFYAVYMAEEITAGVLKESAALLEENQYVKHKGLAAWVYFYEQLHNTEWEYVTGDQKALSAAYTDERSGKTWPSFTTVLSEKSGWAGINNIKFRNDGLTVSVGISMGSDYSYDQETLTCYWKETAYKGADYTIHLTEDGSLHITAKGNDGSVCKCEYRKIG